MQAALEPQVKAHLVRARHFQNVSRRSRCQHDGRRVAGAIEGSIFNEHDPNASF
jgi:hypothetical protein